jgi:hypothetical protein
VSALSDATALSMQDERRMLHAVYRVGMYPCPAQNCVFQHLPSIDLCKEVYVLYKFALRPQAGSLVRLFHDAGDLDKTIEYYEKHFGLKKIRYRDIPDVQPFPDPS